MNALKVAFSGGPISGLENLDSQGVLIQILLLVETETNLYGFHTGWIAGSTANVFVANHDTERVNTYPLLVAIPRTYHSY